MTNEEGNGWSEYKRMVIDWHEDDMKAHDRIDAALFTIQNTLLEIKVQRETHNKWITPITAAVVSLGVAAAAKAFGF